MIERKPLRRRPIRPEAHALQIRNELVRMIVHTMADNGQVETGGGCGAEDIIFFVDGQRVHVQVIWQKPR